MEKKPKMFDGSRLKNVERKKPTDERGYKSDAKATGMKKTGKEKMSEMVRKDKERKKK